MTQTAWPGHYLDGRTAVRRLVLIRAMRSGLEVVVEDGPTRWWPYGEIRQTQGAYAGEQVRLERGAAPGEALLVGDPGFLTAVRRIAPELTAHFHDPSRRRLRVQLTILAATGVLGLTGALYLWGIPAVARFVASRVPVSWEERLGQAIAGEMAPGDRRCRESPHAEAVERVVAAVTAPLAGSPYTVRVLVVDHELVNAFALPGGHIVLFRGLLKRTPRAEALAGVLSHEIQHVVRRHATRTLFEHASTGLLIAALTGDVSGTLAFGLESARTLGVLRYSRQHEEEADLEGARLLEAAGIDPRGMIEFLASLREERGEEPGALRYLSTHPTTTARIERLEALAAASPRPARRLLPDYAWRDVAGICRASPASAEGTEPG